jgi:hypothetical protein
LQVLLRPLPYGRALGLLDQMVKVVERAGHVLHRQRAHREKAAPAAPTSAASVSFCRIPQERPLAKRMLDAELERQTRLKAESPRIRAEASTSIAMPKSRSSD